MWPPLPLEGMALSVNEEKPRKLLQLKCHPLSSMKVKIELLTNVAHSIHIFDQRNYIPWFNASAEHDMLHFWCKHKRNLEFSFPNCLFSCE